MRFDTNTLGYKLTSGHLRENRKHSEQLNKYLAGLMDADGGMSFKISPDRTKGQYRVYISITLTQSASVDPDFELLRSLRDYYNLGSIYYRVVESEVHKSSVGEWKLADREARILYNRIAKHLRVKGTHWDNLVQVSEQLKLSTIGTSAVQELKEYSKCSRQNSKWMRHPKHLSWAWVAGFLDGDGHYRFRHRKGTKHREIYVTFNSSSSDYFISDFFKVCFKGNKYVNAKGLHIWKRALGRDNRSFALVFLKKLRKYSCLINKYSTIDKIIKFHE